MSSAIDPSPEFLRSVRRRLVEVAGASAGRKRLRLPGWFSPWAVVGFLLMLVLPMSWADVGPGVRHLAEAFFVEVVLAMATTRIVNRLADHPHHLPYTVWPASEQEVVSHLLRRNLILTLSSVFLYISVALAVPGLMLNGSFDPRTLLLAAVCLPLLLIRTWVTHRWRWIGWYLSSALWLGVGVALVSGFKVLKGAREVLEGFLAVQGDTVALLLPAGWIILPWSAWTEGGPRILFTFILPLPVVLLALPTALRELREWGRFRDRTLLVALGEIPKDAPEGFSDSVQALRTAEQNAHTPGPTANAEAILSREFLRSPLERPTRRIDQLVWKWWTPSQRLAAECLSQSWPGNRAFGRVALGMIPILWGMTWWMGGQDSAPGAIPALIVPGLLALLGLVPFFCGFSSILRATQFPIRLWDVALLRWKHTAVRCAFAVPTLVVTGSVGTWIAGEPIWMGAVCGFQLAIAPILNSPAATLYGLLNTIRTRSVLGNLLRAASALAFILNLAGFLLLFLPVLGLVFGLLCLGFNTLLLAAVIRWFDACRIEVDPNQVLTEDSPL